jgi:hypothetical protein
MDLAGASQVIGAEHLGEGRIFSTGRRDFRTDRGKKHGALVNLLQPEG